MANYNLPKVPSNQRWYLSRHSNKYACLKLQEESWRGWKDLAEELVSITGTRPFEVAMKDAAEDIIRIVEAPEPKYGVVS